MVWSKETFLHHPPHHRMSHWGRGRQSLTLSLPLRPPQQQSMPKSCWSTGLARKTAKRCVPAWLAKLCVVYYRVILFFFKSYAVVVSESTQRHGDPGGRPHPQRHRHHTQERDPHPQSQRFHRRGVHHEPDSFTAYLQGVGQA